MASRGQSQKNPVSVPARLHGIFLQIRKVFVTKILLSGKFSFFSASGRNNIDNNIDIILIPIISILIYIMLSYMWRVCFRIFEVNIGKRGLTEND